MARVKRGVTSHAKHKKVLEQAKGFYGRRKNTIRIARQAVEKAPAVKSAVEAKGFSARDVVLAQVDNDGELTIVTRKTS